MRISDITVVALGDACELRARVESDADPEGPAWFDPWVLWYRFPAWCQPFLSPENGDPFLTALLPIAMATDPNLVVPVPVSPTLQRATDQIQAIYACFDPRLTRIEIEAPVRDRSASPVANPPDSGLFFSLGVDSFYSLLKNVRNHPGDDETVTHLIAIHGFDAAYGTWDSTFPPAILARAERVAGELGKTLLPVVTNLRIASEPLLSWNMTHGAALASVALALGGLFRHVTIAASTTYDQLYPWGSHPLLDPLWSTERLAVVHDGCELGRIDKTHLVVRSPLVLDTLRVCPGYEAAYNCGQCIKCLPTMIDLLLAGVLERCATLPDTIDVERLRQVFRTYGDHLNRENYQRRLDALGSSPVHAPLREVLSEYLERGPAPDGGNGAPLARSQRRRRLPRWLRRPIR